MYRIAAVGDKDFVLGLKALGVSTFPVKDAEEGASLLRRLEGEDYACIFLPERMAEGMWQVLEEMSARPLPALLIVPSGTTKLGMGMARLKSFVEKAIGADILFTDK